MQDTDLEHFFAESRLDSPMPPVALIARILADADAVQASRAMPTLPPEQSRNSRRWFGWTAAIGGNAVFAGLATAAVAGFWLGIAQPMPVSALAPGFLDVFAAGAGLEAIELIPALDAFGTEG